MTLPVCYCGAISDAGDMAPDVWECPSHGKTGRIRFHLVADAACSKAGFRKDDAWDLMRGLIARWKAQTYLGAQKAVALEAEFQRWIEADYSKP